MLKELFGDFEFEYYNKCYFVEWEASYSLDKNYGADADGNRGEERWILNDVDYYLTDRNDESVYNINLHFKARELALKASEEALYE